MADCCLGGAQAFYLPARLLWAGRGHGSISIGGRWGQGDLPVAIHVYGQGSPLFDSHILAPHRQEKRRQQDGADDHGASLVVSFSGGRSPQAHIAAVGSLDVVDGEVQLAGASQAAPGLGFHHVAYGRGAFGYGDLQPAAGLQSRQIDDLQSGFWGAGTTLRIVANVSRTEPEVARKYPETRLGS